MLGARKVVEVEVFPGDPYSINLLRVAVAERVYIASGSGPAAAWVRALMRERAVLLRIDDQIYRLHATLVTDPAEIDAYIDALDAKYGMRPPRSDFMREGALASPPSPLFRLTRARKND